MEFEEYFSFEAIVGDLIRWRVKGKGTVDANGRRDVEKVLPPRRAWCRAGAKAREGVDPEAVRKQAVWRTVRRECGRQGGKRSAMRWAQNLMQLVGEVRRAVNQAGDCLVIRFGALCAEVLSLIDSRDGDLCVESFDPRIVRWFRFNAPDLLRGQLIDRTRNPDVSPAINFMACHGLLNFLSRPHFIAHSLEKKSLSVRLAEALGAMRICWSVRNRRREGRNDAVIFERFHPPTRYL